MLNNFKYFILFSFYLNVSVHLYRVLISDLNNMRKNQFTKYFIIYFQWSSACLCEIDYIFPQDVIDRCDIEMEDDIIDTIVIYIDYNIFLLTDFIKLYFITIFFNNNI